MATQQEYLHSIIRAVSVLQDGTDEEISQLEIDPLQSADEQLWYLVGELEDM